MIIAVAPQFELEVPDDVRWTREQRTDGPDVYRVFDGIVVMAASAEPLADGDIGDVVGGVISAYLGRPGFDRDRLQQTTVPGSDLAYQFGMRWDSDRGVPMHSLVRIVARADTALVLHAGLPAEFFTGHEAAIGRLLGSARLDERADEP